MSIFLDVQRIAMMCVFFPSVKNFSSVNLAPIFECSIFSENVDFRLQYS